MTVSPTATPTLLVAVPLRGDPLLPGSEMKSFVF